MKLRKKPRINFGFKGQTTEQSPTAKKSSRRDFVEEGGKQKRIGGGHLLSSKPSYLTRVNNILLNYITHRNEQTNKRYIIREEILHLISIKCYQILGIFWGMYTV